MKTMHETVVVISAIEYKTPTYDSIWGAEKKVCNLIIIASAKVVLGVKPQGPNVPNGGHDYMEIMLVVMEKTCCC